MLTTAQQFPDEGEKWKIRAPRELTRVRPTSSPFCIIQKLNDPCRTSYWICRRSSGRRLPAPSGGHQRAVRRRGEIRGRSAMFSLEVYKSKIECEFIQVLLQKVILAKVCCLVGFRLSKFTQTWLVVSPGEVYPPSFCGGAAHHHPTSRIVSPRSLYKTTTNQCSCQMGDMRSLKADEYEGWEIYPQNCSYSLLGCDTSRSHQRLSRQSKELFVENDESTFEFMALGTERTGTVWPATNQSLILTKQQIATAM